MKKELCLKAFFILSFCMSALAMHAQVWQQRGADLNGQAALDRQGSSVSLSNDGKTMAIGCPYSDGSGSDAGTVRVFAWNGTSWIQKGLNINGEAAGDESGSSVSLSADGNTVAIGALHNQALGTNSGHARIYTWDGSAWQQKGIDIDAETSNSYCGFRVSLNADGNTVAVASVISDSTKGSVRVFDWNGSAWQQKGLKIVGDSINDQMGISVTLSADGNTLGVGAQQNDATGYNSGHARVYSWDGAAWQQKGQDIDGTAANNYSGNCVSLSSDGNTFAVGAAANSSLAYQAGQVRVYAWTGTAWQQKGTDIYGQASDDHFGWSLELSADGNTLVGGSIYSNATSQDAGQVRVFEWNGTSWQQKGLEINGGAFGDYLGQAVCIDSAGHTIAMGAPSNDDNGAASGKVRAYSCDRTSTTAVSACDNYISPSGNYTWTNSGVYSDTISSVAGCDSMITINLTINTSPVVSFSLFTDTVCSLDAAFTLTGASPSGGTFSGPGVTGSLFDPNVAALGNNVINYTYTAGNGCQGAMNDSVFVDPCVGTESRNETNTILSLAPNPSNGEIKVSTDGIADQIVVVDLLGNEILSIVPASATVTLDLSNQPAGIYFIKVRSGDSQSASRLLLNK